MSEVIHQVKQYKISQLRKHPNNPRILKDSAYQTLKNSIESNPELLEARPVILSDRTGKLTIIGGNQRFQVVKDLGWLTIPGVLFPDISEEKEKEIKIPIQTDNRTVIYVKESKILTEKWLKPVIVLCTFQ